MKQEELSSAIEKWAEGKDRHALFISFDSKMDSFAAYLSEDPIKSLAMVMASMARVERIKWLVTNAAKFYEGLYNEGLINTQLNPND